MIVSFMVTRTLRCNGDIMVYYGFMDISPTNNMLVYLNRVDPQIDSFIFI